MLKADKPTPVCLKNAQREPTPRTHSQALQTKRRNYSAKNRDCKNRSYFCPPPHFWEWSKFVSYSAKKKNQTKKTNRKKEALFLVQRSRLTGAAQYSAPNEKFRFYTFDSPRFNLNTPRSPYASMTLEYVFLIVSFSAEAVERKWKIC